MQKPIMCWPPQCLCIPLLPGYLSMSFNTGNQLISPKVVILNNPALVSNIQYQAYFSLTSI